ncbi:MAG TPA: acyltransferase [Dictyobacter sp.]|nr:acyltransferase [Dictyobacter sp.]
MHVTQSEGVQVSQAVAIEKGVVQAQKKKNSIPVLDGVRAVAIIAVISFHIGQMTNNHLWNMVKYPLGGAIEIFGESGVTLFFVLSGFLLFLPYARSFVFQSEWPQARAFYLKRVLRIMPAYYIALFGVILLFQRQYLRPDHWKALFFFLVFYMDSTRLTFRLLDGPLWTLAVECQFYLLLPLFMLGFLQVVKRVVADPQRRLRAVFICCVVFIILSLAVRFIGIYYSSRPVWPVFQVVFFFIYGIVGKSWENFAVGMLMCLFYTYAQHPEHGQQMLCRIKQFSLVFLGVGLVVLLFAALWNFNVLQTQIPAFHFLNFLTSLYLIFYGTVVAFGYGFCMLAIIFGPSWLQRIFACWPLRWLGWISYAVYMWHLPWLDFYNEQIEPHLVQWGLSFYPAYVTYWLWAALVVVPIALASYWLVEQPAQRLGSRWLRRARPVS